MPIYITDGTVAPDVDGQISRSMDSFTCSLKDAVSYPLTYTSRGGSLNWAQDGASAATDRIAIGMMDACHLIGFNSGDQADRTPPTTGYIARTDATKEILAASPDSSHYMCTYFVMTEAADSDTDKVAYIETLDGPGSDDGWAYNSANERVLLFADAYTINLSSYVADKNGLNYCEWFADNVVQPKYIDPHIVAGVKIGGPGGINVMMDNFQHHSNKSGIDWNNDGSNDDAQDYYDSEEVSHVTGSATAVTAYSSVRANQMSGLERIRSNNPGIFILPNTNQWADKPLDRLDKPESLGELRNCILEYRLSGDPDQANVGGGFSEGNSGNSTYRSGVFSDGTAAPSGNWLQAYFNAYQSVRLCQEPSIVAMSFWVQCLQSGVAGPGGKTTWSPVPASNAIWNMARWAMCTAWIAGAHASITGIQVGASTAGRAQSTPLFDEYGLINGSVDYGFGAGPTKLYHKWMGIPIDDPPTVAHSGTIWIREFTNALIVLNSDNDPANPDSVVDVSGLPGGASEWTRFIGSQDSSVNTGNPASIDFNIPPVNAIVLARKSWYDAL